VSNFRLDKYEVTVGRFRSFKTAWQGGWRPPAGAGKHTHLNGGSGLTDSSGTTTYEQGWDTAWASSVAPTDANLLCNSSFETWTVSPGPNEVRPINCVNWFEAYAFCIWDEAFLPSEAEWNYAASGGAEQRVFPWSNPASAAVIDCTYANYYNGVPCQTTDPDVVGHESPKGDGKYGQADLGGNAWEWLLDSAGAYGPTCNDCASLPPSATSRGNRGGSFNQGVLPLYSSFRSSALATPHSFIYGVRCARAP
jgi:formylglycine-generating enzyme required for sulfatase activity